MATLIRRAEALKRLNILEEKAIAAKDRAGAEMIVKCWNAIMSCKVEERVFCTRCGKVIQADKIPEDDQLGGHKARNTSGTDDNGGIFEMRPFEHLRMEPRFQKRETIIDGVSGWVTIKGQILFCIASNGGGWDHVFVIHKKRCPTWEEMCVIKEIFFFPEECCCEYHPAESDYVNVHPFCLHIWKPQNGELPKPPKYFV